jgi:hypothetical protein
VFEAAIEVPLEEYETELVGCDWAPDPATVADAVGVDYRDLTVLDLNPSRSNKAALWGDA